MNRILPVWFILILFIRCTKPEIHAEKSLLGSWKVDSLYMMYSKSPSQSIDSIWRFNKPSGKITFRADEVNIEYNLRNKKVMLTGGYKLWSYRENAGFFKVRKWELTVSDKLYKVEFGNETKHAHKNAERILLTLKPSTTGKREAEMLFMSKE
jgi:hypothetical protein